MLKTSNKYYQEDTHIASLLGTDPNIVWYVRPRLIHPFYNGDFDLLLRRTIDHAKNNLQNIEQLRKSKREFTHTQMETLEGQEKKQLFYGDVIVFLTTLTPERKKMLLQAYL